jgi:insertion element IS1 protein InsB
MDERWFYVHDKGYQCWFWHVIDHCSGEVLAYTFETREHCVLEELLLLLKPFSVSKVYAGGNYVYEKILGVDKVKVGRGMRRRLSVSICRYVLG